MQQVRIDTMLPAREASLSELAIALGVTTIPRDEAKAHMEAELKKAPKPLPFAKLIAKHLESILFAMFITSLAAIVAGFGLAAYQMGYASLAGLFNWVLCGTGVAMMIGGAISVFAIFVVALDDGGIHILTGKARWESQSIDLTRGHRSGVASKAHLAAAAIATRLAKAGLKVTATRHTLMQDSVILDPVIELQAEGFADGIFVAIYDENTGYCRTASIS